MKTFLLILQIFRDLFLRFLPFPIHQDYRFAFLVHPRSLKDVYLKFPFSKKLPDKIVKFYCKHAWPIIVCNVHGLKTAKSKEEVQGCIISIPMTARQMLENRDLALKRIIGACGLAQNLGVSIVGLGALTSSLTNGGLKLAGKVKAKVTTGNSLTVAVALEHLKEIINHWPNQFEKIGIVGATGSIGKALTKLLIKEYPHKKYQLFAHTQEHLRSLIQELNRQTNSTEIQGYLNNLSSLKEVDLAVVATSAAGAIIRSEHLKNGAVVYDMTQPRNVSNELVKKRQDVTILSGGLIECPAGINYRLKWEIPKGTIFACLAETMILALEDNREDFSLGVVLPKQALRILELAKKNNFKPAPLHFLQDK